MYSSFVQLCIPSAGSPLLSVEDSHGDFDNHFYIVNLG